LQSRNKEKKRGEHNTGWKKNPGEGDADAGEEIPGKRGEDFGQSRVVV
jgi:hypothetical protein